jgi:hypothetical protein
MQTTNFGDERFQCILLVSNYQIKSNGKKVAPFMRTVFPNNAVLRFVILKLIKPLVQNYSVLQKL